MKIKKSFGRRFATMLTVILTLSMLLLAATYIGGTQFAPEGSAISLSGMPSGTVSAGGAYDYETPIYEKRLLPLNFAAITFGGKGGGAYGSEDAAAALFDFAAEPVHVCLSVGAKLSEITAEEYFSATYGDYVCLDFVSTVPYQLLYMLTGENDAAARSETAISADRIILTLDGGSVASLYLSDGESFYRSEQSGSYRYSEAMALASDSRLSPFSVKEGGVPVSTASQTVYPLKIKASATLAESDRETLFSLLGYDYEEGMLTAVATHGTVSLTDSTLIYTASQDGGLPVSAFLQYPKDALDVTIYDVLQSCVGLCEELCGTVQGAFSGADLFIKGFYRDGESYIAVIGSSVDSVELLGESYPYSARLTVQGGRFESIELRFLQVEKEAFSVPLFQSLWQYEHAAAGASVTKLRPIYRFYLPEESDVSPTWYFTGEKKGGSAL